MDMCIDMCMNTLTQVCMGMWVDMRTAMSVESFMGMCRDMQWDMRMNTRCAQRVEKSVHMGINV